MQDKQRVILKKLIELICQSGFKFRIGDGEDCSKWFSTPDNQEELVADLEEAWIYVTKCGDYASIYLIFGNEPREIVADYHVWVDGHFMNDFQTWLQTNY